MKQKQLYNTPSGLGGSFDVVILRRKPRRRDLVLVQVEMGSPDWDGYTFTAKLSDLTPVDRKDYAVGNSAALALGRGT